MNEHKPLVLYAKNEKGKYVPVSQHESLDYWREGSYLVDIRPGWKTVRRKLSTSLVSDKVQAVVNRLSEKIVERMAELDREPIFPVKKPLTKKQQSAWKMWKDAFKRDTVWFRSRHDIVEEAMQLVVDEIAKENT